MTNIRKIFYKLNIKERTAYVFVVCGSEAHISTLHTSLRFLKNFSDREIIIITDLSRNKCPIKHHMVIDVTTDHTFSDAEAAIFLKTSIHHYLDMSDMLYCYLDNDVLAVSKEADFIFDQPFETIGFCPDNIQFDDFSPYAIQCPCIEMASNNQALLSDAIAQYEALFENWEKHCMQPQGKALQTYLSDINKNKVQHIRSLLFFLLQKSYPLTAKIRLKNWYQLKKNKIWYDKNDNMVLYPLEKFSTFIHRKTGFEYHSNNKFWSLPNDFRDVTRPRCTHLHEALNASYGIRVWPDNWQHPNGGFFLFDKRSVNFLEVWHKHCMGIFKRAPWKTRDQAMLALTIWETGLQKMNYLPVVYNYIIDYFCDNIVYHPEKGFTKDAFKTCHQPAFVHVFHHFGDTGWPLWNTLMSFINNK